MVLKHFVVKNREVQGEAELDGVAGGKVNFVGFLVGCVGLLLHFLEFITLGVLSDVPVVIANHLDKEGLGLRLTGG